MNNYIERILARNKEPLPLYELRGTLSEPVGFEDLQEDLRELIGSRTAEQAKLFGLRTGEMHKALAMARGQHDFKPEEFSLHYQRSLFASMQSLVRESFQLAQRLLQGLPDGVKGEVQQMLSMKEDILKALKSIYSKKLDVLKIRIHGNYGLDQILLTGKDVAIQDFVGDSSTSYSDRRLKRSPLRDVAGMIRSFHNVAYEGVFLNNLVQNEDIGKSIPFAILWAHYTTGFFMKAYLESIQGTMFIPDEMADLKTMLKFYLLRKAFYDLNYELKHRPDRVAVPLRLIRSIVR